MPEILADVLVKCEKDYKISEHLEACICSKTFNDELVVTCKEL